MPAITIVGAGVFGLSIAHSLPLAYDITIVARDMPGDPDSLEWASPWAGAGYGAGGTKDPVEKEIYKASFRWFWDISARFPESTVRRIRSQLFRDNTSTDDDLWWKGYLPDYRIMDPSELPPDSNAKIAIEHSSIVLTPPAYIQWLYDRLVARGVRFVRGTVSSIAEVQSGTFGPEPDVIVNATGVGAKTLGGVMDGDVEPIRGQTMLIRDKTGKIDTMVLRSGIDYCYVIPRLDGTVVLGGIKDNGDTSPEVKPEQKADIAKRCHQLNPLVPDDWTQMEIVRDIVGIRPGRKTGLRVESELIDGAKVVHAYGGAGGGYALSAGVGRRVAFLVDEFIYADPNPVKINVTRDGARSRCICQ